MQITANPFGRASLAKLQIFAFSLLVFALMLYYLLFRVLFSLRPEFSVLNVTRYITFRTAAATLSALAISLVFGPWLIRKLREFQIGRLHEVTRSQLRVDRRRRVLLERNPIDE